MQIKNFDPRPYQEKIVETAKKKNTLVVLPTGLGKTKVAILLTKERLTTFENTKVVIVTPTKPLAAQIQKEFRECLDIPKEKVILLTGAIAPEKRKELYKEAQIIVATPQTIEEDIEKKRIPLEEISLLIIDEAHRSRERFANTVVAKIYQEQGKNQRILALTASPGSTKEKIDEVCKNLFIDAVEIRNETDTEVIPYLQKKEIEYYYVELPPEIRAVHELMKTTYKERMENIKSFIPYKPVSAINKLDLLKLQPYLQRQIKLKNNSAYYGLSLVAQLLKLNHAVEMIETQGISSFCEFIKKLETEETKAAKNILKEPKVQQARVAAEQLLEKETDHPKINKLKELLQKTTEEKPDARIIIFATYRNTVDTLLNTIRKIGISAIKLVGQKEGLTQKEQIATIQEFNDGKYNCLITTSIGEEGLHIGEADMAIFYDNSPSSIRKIQRSGRVGRMKSGKIIFMITKNTKDAAYFYKSRRDESKMKTILEDMKEGQDIKTNKTLDEFTNGSN